MALKLQPQDKFKKWLGQPVTTFTDEQGNPWYPASEILKVLGLSDNRVVHNNVQPCMVTYHLYQTDGGSQSIMVINDAAVCRLLLKSPAPAAKGLVDKMTDVILPTIRKYGCYMNGVEKLNEAQATAIAIRMIEKFCRKPEVDAGYEEDC